jgi:hypothetical protein
VIRTRIARIGHERNFVPIVSFHEQALGWNAVHPAEA